MKKLLLILSVGVLSAGFITGCGTQSSPTDKTQEEQIEVKNTGEVVQELVEDGTLDNIVTNTYQEFSKEALAKALEEKKDVVLFYYADRCPSCIALDENINENIDILPENLVLLKVDYDEEEELKKYFQVRQQHTLIFLDETGEKKEMTTGIATAEQIVWKIN